MNRRLLVLLILLPCCFLTACGSYVPRLQVVGDVERALSVADLDELGQSSRVTVHGETCRALTLAQVAEAAGAVRVEQALFIAEDGFSAAISGDSLDQCYLTFDPANSWHCLSDTLPVSVNGVDLVRIVLVAENEGTRFTVEDGDESRQWSLGQLYAGPLLSYPYPEGVAETVGTQGTLTSTVSTRRDCVSAAMLDCGGCELRLTSRDGQSRLIPADCGLFELDGNYLTYINSETRVRMEDVVLIQVLRTRDDKDTE